MKRIHALALMMAASFSLSAFAVDPDGNPPGPAGGPGSNWENRPGPAGGPGASPDRRPRLSPEQREKLMAMSPEEHQALAMKIREGRAQMHRDPDGNPPGPAGGPGSNWENRPGPVGGPGASPDRHPRLSPEQREKLMAMSPEERQTLAMKIRERRAQMYRDRDNNPPGAAGGPGSNWENRPGPVGGPGASPDRL